MSTIQETTSPLPPAHLPIDPRVFYSTPANGKVVPLTPQAETQHILEQLGPPAFRKSSFPVVGFLASLYEHVAAHVSGEIKP
jgi:hypothetical protein